MPTPPLYPARPTRWALAGVCMLVAELAHPLLLEWLAAAAGPGWHWPEWLHAGLWLGAGVCFVGFVLSACREATGAFGREVRQAWRATTGWMHSAPASVSGFAPGDAVAPDFWAMDSQPPDDTPGAKP